MKNIYQILLVSLNVDYLCQLLQMTHLLIKSKNKNKLNQNKTDSNLKRFQIKHNLHWSLLTALKDEITQWVLESSKIRQPLLQVKKKASWVLFRIEKLSVNKMKGMMKMRCFKILESRKWIQNKVLPVLTNLSRFHNLSIT